MLYFYIMKSIFALKKSFPRNKIFFKYNIVNMSEKHPKVVPKTIKRLRPSILIHWTALAFLTTKPGK